MNRQSQRQAAERAWEDIEKVAVAAAARSARDAVSKARVQVGDRQLPSLDDVKTKTDLAVSLS